MIGFVLRDLLGSACTGFVGFMASMIALGRVSPLWAYSLLAAYLVRVFIEILRPRPVVR